MTKHKTRTRPGQPVTPKDLTVDWAGKVKHNEISPVLTFTPTAWAKINYFYQNQDNIEVSGFGITHPDNPLCVTDFVLIKQQGTAISTTLDNDGFSTYLEDRADEGIPPSQCARVWIHTHPGMPPNPSGTDEDTFTSKFGSYDWAIMCILGHNGQIRADLRIKKPVRLRLSLKTNVDYSVPFEQINYEALAAEYREKVSEGCRTYNWKSATRTGKGKSQPSSPQYLSGFYAAGLEFDEEEWDIEEDVNSGMISMECPECSAAYEVYDDGEVYICPDCNTDLEPFV